MSVIVSDEGFCEDDWTAGFTVVPNEAIGENAPGLDVPSDANPVELFANLVGVRVLRVEFKSFADGRGFSLARQLRLLGYKGRLRALGPLLSDQYAMARRSGFDEVEISAEQAKRMPEASWVFRADWRSHDYQSRLRG